MDAMKITRRKELEDTLNINYEWLEKINNNILVLETAKSLGKKINEDELTMAKIQRDSLINTIETIESELNNIEQNK